MHCVDNDYRLHRNTARTPITWANPKAARHVRRARRWVAGVGNPRGFGRGLRQPMGENVGSMTLPTPLPAPAPPSPLAWSIDQDHPAAVHAKRWRDANAIP